MFQQYALGKLVRVHSEEWVRDVFEKDCLDVQPGVGTKNRNGSMTINVSLYLKRMPLLVTLVSRQRRS